MARGKKTASSRLNRRKYAELLSATLPRIIENDAELERVAQGVEALLDKLQIFILRTKKQECLLRRNAYFTLDYFHLFI